VTLYAKRLMGVMVAATVVALAAAGCSSSSKASSDSGTAAAAGGGSTPSGSPIQIGMICSCTGGASTGDAVAKIYEGWADSVNDGGGINGHPVKVTVKDDAANPSTSQSIAQGFISSHVIAIVDATNDDVAWQKAVDAAKIPVIGSSTATAPFYTDSNFYAEGQTEDSLFEGVVGAAKKENATNLGLMYCAEAVECQEGIAPLKAVAAAASLKLGYTGSIAATAPNYTAQCIAAKQEGVDALFVGDVSQVIAKVGSNCQAQGFSPPIVIDGTQLGPSLTTANGVKENSIYILPNLPYFSTEPGAVAMMAGIKKYAPSALANPAGFGEGAVQSWISGKLFEAAAKAGNLGASGAEPTSAALIQGLHALKGETLDGLAPPLTFVADKPNPVHCWYLATIKDGQLGTPYGIAPQCSTS
jgi:branched-chain amino acid transport system substrate-binding protein